jgi:RHS repeat-associated protein
VYFDNMTVTHTPGRVLEVNTYYPYGMLIPELSAKAATKDEQNWYKFSSKELETALNLGWYDFHTRPYAPVIGKFLTPDPHAENYYSMSPYAYTGNNPVNNIDPTGMDWYSWLEKYREEDIKEIQTRTRYMYVEGTMSQKEMDEGGYTHVGESFFGWNDAGNRQSWNVDGTTTDLGPNRLSGVTITGKMSEHARLMSSPGVQAVHQGHEEFINELGDFFTMLGNVLTYGSFSAPPPEHRLVTGTAPTPGRFKGGGSIKGGKLFQKMGRAKGNMSGNHAVQNEQARAIVKALGVNNDPDKVRQIHDYISGMGWGYQEALQEVKYFLNIK